MGAENRAREPDVAQAGKVSKWGGKLFFATLLVILVFFWWLLIYSGGVAGKHG